MSKKCKECNQTKILNDFVNNNTGKYNKSSRCKICMKSHYKIYCKTYYEKNKVDLIQKQKNYNNNNKAHIKDYMKNYYSQNKGNKD
jgi:hypothetical protein